VSDYIRELHRLSGELLLLYGGLLKNENTQRRRDSARAIRLDLDKLAEALIEVRDKSAREVLGLSSKKLVRKFAGGSAAIGSNKWGLRFRSRLLWFLMVFAGHARAGFSSLSRIGSIPEAADRSASGRGATTVHRSFQNLARASGTHQAINGGLLFFSRPTKSGTTRYMPLRRRMSSRSANGCSPWRPTIPDMFCRTSHRCVTGMADRSIRRSCGPQAIGWNWSSSQGSSLGREVD
jgi:hypothetical protein